MSQVTWTRDISPIVERRCAGCHRPGGAAALQLTTYDEVRAHARAVLEEVQEGRMPPWPGARGYGDYANERALSAVEIEMLTAWAQGRTPLGPPLPASRTSARHARGADAVLRTEPGGISNGPPRLLSFKPALERARSVSAWEFVPADAAAIDEAVVSTDTGLVIGSWLAGDGVISFPPGIAARVPAGARLFADVRYRRQAAVASAGGSLRLYFGKDSDRPVQHRTVHCGDTTLGEAQELVALQPLAPAAGDSLDAVAIARDGGVQPLFLVPWFQPAYRVTFRFRTPVSVQAGATVRLKGSQGGCSANLQFVAAVRSGH